MAFERFTRTGSRGYKPKASIWSRGQIGFNQGSVKTFDLEKYKYAILFYDREQRIIGVRFTDDENEKCITKLIIRPNGASISARAFLNYYNIDYTKTTKCDITYDEKEHIFVLTPE